MRNDVFNRLTAAIKSNGDIDQHLIFLTGEASKCSSILECGVRGIVSTWAFIAGLSMNQSAGKILHCCDIAYIGAAALDEVTGHCAASDIGFNFFHQNDLTLPNARYDMIFIDTLHCYGQLRRELEKFSKNTETIILHDTQIDGEVGEPIRNGWDVGSLSEQLGWDKSDLELGLTPAIDEFLITNPDWHIAYQAEHQNGLTMLCRATPCEKL